MRFLHRHQLRAEIAKRLVKELDLSDAEIALLWPAIDEETRPEAVPHLDGLTAVTVDAMTDRVARTVFPGRTRRWSLL
jgi:hypothetical protein